MNKTQSVEAVAAKADLSLKLRMAIHQHNKYVWISRCKIDIIFRCMQYSQMGICNSAVLLSTASILDSVAYF